jgi:ribosomal-protein-alanine N-acetyltransferase
MAITLKKATLNDLEVILDLVKTADGIKTYSVTTDPEEMLADLKKGEAFLIEKDNQIIGSVMYEIKSPTHSYLSDLVIRPDFQGQGIGREAMTEILKKLHGYPRIDLVTHPENVRAIKLYESLGFVIESRKENYFGDGEPRVVMVRGR